MYWDERKYLGYFVFDPTYINKGINPFPIAFPADKSRKDRVAWGDDTDKRFHRIPPFIADSLPDAWGNSLFKEWERKFNIKESETSPLDKLSFIGKRGMGALEFVPAYNITGCDKIENLKIEKLYKLSKIYENRENRKIENEDSLTMKALMYVGTSVGGRMAKAVISINRESGEIRSGQTDLKGRKEKESRILKR